MLLSAWRPPRNSQRGANRFLSACETAQMPSAQLLLHPLLLVCLLLLLLSLLLLHHLLLPLPFIGQCVVYSFNSSKFSSNLIHIRPSLPFAAALVYSSHVFAQRTKSLPTLLPSPFLFISPAPWTTVSDGNWVGNRVSNCFVCSPCNHRTLAAHFA